MSGLMGNPGSVRRSGFYQGFFGDGRTSQDLNVNTPPPSAEEQELIRLNTELTRLQLDNINNLAPFQRELIESSLADLRRQRALNDEFDRAVTPQQQAELMKQEFERAKRMGPINDQILDMQMANMRGELTPGQQKAVEAAVKAGGEDIDLATKESLGLVSDELANSRGLRLSDTPILREATLLAKSGLEQKASLSRNVRSQALFQMPGQSASIGLAQQQIGSQAQAFQADLRQRAAQNRMALTGQTASSGIGLAGVAGVGVGTLGALSGVRGVNRHTTGTGWDPGAFLQQHGSLAPWRSDRRLKEDIHRIGTLPNGIPVYTFRFIGDDAVHTGVMADEVLKVIPEAVSKDADGYYLVDYAKLH